MNTKYYVNTALLIIALLIVPLSASGFVTHPRSNVTSSIFVIEDEPKLSPFTAIRFHKSYFPDGKEFAYFVEFYISYSYPDSNVVGQQIVDVINVGDMIFDKRPTVTINDVSYSLSLEEQKPDLLLPGSALGGGLVRLPKEAALKIQKAKKITFEFVFLIRRLQTQKWIVPNDVLSEWKSL